MALSLSLIWVHGHWNIKYIESAVYVVMENFELNELFKLAEIMKIMLIELSGGTTDQTTVLPINLI